MVENDRAPQLQTGVGMDWDEFTKWGKHLSGWAAEYHQTLRDRPVRAQTRPGDTARMLDAAPPTHGEPMEAIMTDFERIVMPGMTHWQHPRFFAYFPANATPPSMLAEYPRHHDRAAMHALADVPRCDRNGNASWSTGFDRRLPCRTATPASSRISASSATLVGGPHDARAGHRLTLEIVTDCPASRRLRRLLLRPGSHLDRPRGLGGGDRRR